MEEFVSLVKNSNPSCLSKESGSAMKKVLEQRSRLFALNVPEFVSLSSNDQVVLQEENIGPLIELRVATFFHTGLWWAFLPMTKNCPSLNRIFLTFSAHTINCVCHSTRSMFRVLGIYISAGDHEVFSKRSNNSVEMYFEIALSYSLTGTGARLAK